MKYNDIVDLYDNMMKKQERDRIISFLKELVADFEKFGDPAEDYKAVIKVLESEDWALGK